MFFFLVQVSLLPISSTAIELSSGDFVETSNQTATQHPEVSSENAPVEVVEEKEKDEGEGKGESKEVFHNGLFSCPSEGCVFEFQKYSNLEYYIIYGKYRIEEEKTTLIDKARRNKHTTSDGQLHCTDVKLELDKTFGRLGSEGV